MFLIVIGVPELSDTAERVAAATGVAPSHNRPRNGG
jgi:hypothetical protein